MNVSWHHMHYAFGFFIPQKDVATIRTRNDELTFSAEKVDSFYFRKDIEKFDEALLPT